MKAQSHCCICNTSRLFRPTILFESSPFPQYAGTVVSECSVCGCYKTTKKTPEFNPSQSRFEMYENASSDFEKEFEPIIRSITGRISKKGRILDVGCSSGILLRILQEKGYSVWGVEANRDAYLTTQKSLKGRVVHGTLKQSLEKLPKEFDCIIYNHVLEHIEDPRAELEGALTLLKSGGVLIVGIPTRDNWIAKLRNERWESLMPGEHIWHFRTIDMITILKQLQTKIVSISFSNHHRRDYPSVKKILFGLLRILNTLTRTGEAVLIVAIKKV